MHLFVLGPTGRTGREIASLAKARGHRLTLFTRSPQKLGALADAPGVEVACGDARDADALAAAMRGHDAVLSALGPKPLDAITGATLLGECAAATVGAMTRASVPRLAVVSAALLFPLKDLPARVLRVVLRHHLRDCATMESIVEASGLRWTIARPPRLLHGVATEYRAAKDALPGRTATFASVAAFLLDCVERNAHVGAVVGVSR